MEEKILELLKEKGGLTFAGLLKELNTTNEELSKALLPLENIKIIKFGKVYELIDNNSIYSGTIFFKNERAYILTENKSYLISEADSLNVYKGDRYIFTLDEDRRGKKIVNLVKFISHDNLPIVCVAGKEKADNSRNYKVYDASSVIKKFKVYGKNNVKVGDLCFIEPIYQKEGTLYLGKFLNIISSGNDVGNDVMALICEAGVLYEFGSGVKEEIKNIPLSVSKEELKGRVDFTNDLVITIDGADSKDFDDAVSLKVLDNGNYQLGVHIADVSHYVKEGSEIDKEALARGTSIYLVDRVIPMLDFKLSNGICSLNEGVIRLTLSTILEFSKDGTLINSAIVSSYIKSSHRMTYEDCNLMLDKADQGLINKYRDIYPMLVMMAELSKMIRLKRTKQGAIDFDIPETKIEVDQLGSPISVGVRERGTSELIIEDFMLSANQVVAETLNHLEYPCPYRVHEEPDNDKLKELIPLVNSLGISLHLTGAGIKSKDIQNILDKVKDLPSGSSISQLVLRAMAKARYDSACLGHFGLAMPYYCHFTSPIRRYPDLEVHRIINSLIVDTNDFKSRYSHFEDTIDRICLISSNAERKAIGLERTVLDMKAAEYMASYIGSCFDGVISSVTSFGIYVMLDNGIEGLCHIANMPDYFSYDEKQMALVGNYSKEVYNIGDKVKVRVIDSNKLTRKIDFIVLNHFNKK